MIKMVQNLISFSLMKIVPPCFLRNQQIFIDKFLTTTGRTLNFVKCSPSLMCMDFFVSPRISSDSPDLAVPISRKSLIGRRSLFRSNPNCLAKLVLITVRQVFPESTKATLVVCPILISTYFQYLIVDFVCDNSAICGVS